VIPEIMIQDKPDVSEEEDEFAVTDDSLKRLYEERNANALNLIVYNKHAALIRSELALNLIRDLTFAHTCLSPGFHIGWVHESSLTSGDYRAKLSALRDLKRTLTATSFHKSRDHGRVGVNLSGMRDSGLVIHLNYVFEWGASYRNHDSSLRFEWNF